MRDRDVRQALMAQLQAEHARDPDTRIVEEMGVWSGSVRIDVAVINGELCGYELKSDRDNLDRLPAQAELYSKLFDKVFLVVGPKHHGKSRRVIPRWWGVILANPSSAGIRLELVRQPKPNPKPDPLLIAQLLWRDEALEVLESAGLARGYRAKPAPVIYSRLAMELPLATLADATRTALKRRQGWLGQPVSNQ